MNHKDSSSQPLKSTENHSTQYNAVQKNFSDNTVNQERMIATAQRQKARRLLALLQWVAFVVLLIGIIWLYIVQQRQYTEIIQRMQSNAQLIDRINVLEDKLVASSQTATAKNNDNATNIDDVSNQSKAQLEQIRLQIQAANILSNNGQIPEAIQLLQGVSWQLKQKNNQIAPALTLVLSKSLDNDIAMLENISNQSDDWQNQTLAIQAVQKFLYGSIHNNVSDSTNDETRVAGDNTTLTPSPALPKAIISPQDAIIYDVLMQLNLAQQAASDKDATMLKLYLTQSIERLSFIDRTSQRVATSMTSDTGNPSHDISQDKKNTPAQQNNNVGNTERQNITAHRVHALSSIADASKLLQQLAQQSPKPIRITTMQVVAAPENAEIQ